MMGILPETSQDPLDDIPPMAWHGGDLECSGCEARMKGARCQVGHACVQDRYAKRIDRFFRWNPELSNPFLHHPYFEVRAIACRRGDVFHLQSLIDDEDETVRLSVAVRLPLAQVVKLRDDPHREVRIRVAMRLEGRELLAMAGDEDYYVRKLVAQRLPDALLPRMLDDSDAEVRLEAVRRLEMPALLRMCDDPEISIRKEVAQRLPESQLYRMAYDPAWEVRWIVAGRAGRALALQMSAGDDEDDVRAEALARLDELDREQGDRHG
ncbi:4Fe4S-binding leucine-rich repeat protein [Methyloversatilis sp.]|uniref:4Fe4S-binding leucine-rich repeat protein n=1 Tax=Methyloversatilis sp. TaxID=2569862 RepID=UPI0035B0462D